jgi:hypothetical protein
MNKTHKYGFLESLDLSEDVRLRLSLLLSRTLSGSDEVYVTPYGKNHDPEKLLEEWDRIVDANKDKLNKALTELEESNRSKFGPRSIAKDWGDRRELITAYFGDSTFNFNDSELVLSDTTRRLRPLSLDSATSYLKNNTNSGLPFYVPKGKVKEEVLANFDSLLFRKDPCVLFTRTQESKKTRAVWGFPIADTLNEMRYYRPVLDIQRLLNWRSAIVHPDEVDKKITELINYSQSSGETLISMDFSSYDATLREGHQKAAFQYIKSMFQEQYADEIDYIADRFGTIGLVTPEGVMNGKHGVPSGSTFTNEVDSICQYQMAMNIDPDLKHFQIQGDDGAYSHHNPEALMEGFESLGMEVNKEKSHLADNWLTYLQMLYHDEYRDASGLIGGIYPTYRALNRLVYQERFDDFKEYGLEGSDFYAIRTLSILENCRNHPLFEEFVKFIMKIDKYGLEPSQQGIEKYVRMLRDKVGVEGIFSHQYGTDVSGLRSFKSYKIISEQ